MAPSIKGEEVLKISDLVSVPLSAPWHANAIITWHVERDRHVLDICQFVLFSFSDCRPIINELLEALSELILPDVVVLSRWFPIVSASPKV